jgi:hypothetical protein
LNLNAITNNREEYQVNLFIIYSIYRTNNKTCNHYKIKIYKEVYKLKGIIEDQSMMKAEIH